MKIIEWEKEASRMTNEDLERIIKAIETLNEWEAFKREYGWTGTEQLKAILIGEINVRKILGVKVIPTEKGDNHV